MTATARRNVVPCAGVLAQARGASETGVPPPRHRAATRAGRTGCADTSRGWTARAAGRSLASPTRRSSTARISVVEAKPRAASSRTMALHSASISSRPRLPCGSRALPAPGTAPARAPRAPHTRPGRADRVWRRPSLWRVRPARLTWIWKYSRRCGTGLGSAVCALRMPKSAWRERPAIV